jgi:hypothetical protein
VGDVGAQITSPLGKAGLSCANVGVSRHAALRSSKAPARSGRRENEAVSDVGVTLAMCDKGKQAELSSPLACRMCPVAGFKVVEEGLERTGGAETHNRRHDQGRVTVSPLDSSLSL